MATNTRDLTAIKARAQAVAADGDLTDAVCLQCLGSETAHNEHCKVPGRSYAQRWAVPTLAREAFRDGKRLAADVLSLCALYEASQDALTDALAQLGDARGLLMDCWHQLDGDGYVLLTLEAV